MDLIKKIQKPLGCAHQIAFVLGVLGLSWVGMMAVHELGHVLGARRSGGVVQSVVIPMFGFSRTDVQPNPSPSVTVWTGPILGVLVPLMAWFAVTCKQRQPLEKPLRFFAGFCLIANGAYLSLGTFERIGDVGVMLETGTPIWLLWVWGILTVPLGFMLWHGLGPRLGLKKLHPSWIGWTLLILALVLCFVEIKIVLSD